MEKKVDRMKVDKELKIPVDIVDLQAILKVPEDPKGLVIFAHGSGSSRKSPRNQFVAEKLRDKKLGTLLFDLLTEEEDRVREARFDINLLTQRLEEVTDWAGNQDELENLEIGYFGSSTGAAAALRAAGDTPNIKAVVSRGGRTDLASEDLPAVKAATLFIVGGEDETVLELNKQSLKTLKCEKKLGIVPGAGHLFEGEGELEQVAELAAEWFEKHLGDDQNGS